MDPIKKDVLWFFGNVRYFGNAQDIPGSYANANAGESRMRGPTRRTPPSPTGTRRQQGIYSGRVTWQATPRNKIGVYFDHQTQLQSGVVL